MTSTAVASLIDIEKIISNKYLDFYSAVLYVRFIKNRIYTLNELPNRFVKVSIEPFASRNIRRMLVKDYFVYYLVDDLNLMVYIIDIIYSKRSQKYALEKMHIK